MNVPFADSDRRLLNLETDVAKHLRAGFRISTLSQAVEICVLNSLHARATEIHIEIHTDSPECLVTDNGHGIPRDDLARLGSWNASSKTLEWDAWNLPHGRGEGLAALCSVAAMAITSRAINAFETHMAVFEGGNLTKLHVAEQQRKLSGTSIYIKDLFFNRPVVRKAFATDAGTAEAGREVEECRALLDGLAAVHPLVTFTLYDRARRTFLTQHLQGRSSLQPVLRLFALQSCDDVAVLHDERGLWRVDGWAARPPKGHATTSRQRIFINGRPAKAPDIADVIDAIFAELYTVNVKVERSRATGGELLAVRKACNLHAMYCLALRGPVAAQELIVEPGGALLCPTDSTQLISAVRAALLQGWKPVLTTSMIDAEVREREEAMAADKQRRPERQNVKRPRFSRPAPSPLVRVHPQRSDDRTEDANAVGGNTFIGSGMYCSSAADTRHVQQESRDIDGRSDSRRCTTGPVITSLAPDEAASMPPVQQHCLGLHSLHGFDTGTNRTKEPDGSKNASLPFGVDQHAPMRTLSKLLEHPATAAPPMIAWRKRRHASYMTHLPSIERLPGKQPLGHSDAAPGTRYFNQRRPGEHSITEATPNLDNILAHWRNPVMMPSTSATVSNAVASLESMEAAVFSRLRPAALTREDLSGARSLRQVDSKYVPIVTRTGILALVDQHAADERVQLERLRAQVVNADGCPVGGWNASMALATPQTVVFGADEMPLLQAHARSAMMWGWRWSLTVPHQPQHHATVAAMGMPDDRIAPGACLTAITHVPLVANRALLSSELKLYVHQLEESRGAVGPPSGVIRVLNSKSCRSAIMFGDELMPQECQHLVEALQKTQLCFVCAHGRPTTVAVADLAAVRKAALVIQAATMAKTRRETDDMSGYEKTSLKGLKTRLLGILSRV